MASHASTIRKRAASTLQRRVTFDDVARIGETMDELPEIDDLAVVSLLGQSGAEARRVAGLELRAGRCQVIAATRAATGCVLWARDFTAAGMSRYGVEDEERCSPRAV